MSISVKRIKLPGTAAEAALKFNSCRNVGKKSVLCLEAPMMGVETCRSADCDGLYSPGPSTKLSLGTTTPLVICCSTHTNAIS